MIEFVTDLAKRAGAILLEHYRPLGRPEIVNRKSAQVRNLVTAADTASEELIVAALRREFPDHGVVAEEGGGGDRDRESVWHVDPLDGTVNFAHSFPFFCVSIGLVRRGEPVLGVVHAPVLGETWAGEKGGTATLNGEPIRVSTTDALIESLLATGFPYDRNENPDNNVDHFTDLILKVRGLRRAGAAAIDMCFVATGRFDGYWELGLSTWDVAAGTAIVRAAGGTVTDFDGGDDFLTGRRIVATNGRIHAALRAALER